MATTLTQTLTSTCLQVMLLGGIASWPGTAHGFEADDALLDALFSTEPMVVVERVDVAGLLAPDEARVREELGVKAGDDLLRPRVHAALERLRAANEFAVGDPAETPAPENRVNLAYRFYYRQPPLAMVVDDSGALTVQLGTARVVEGARPAAELIPAEGEKPAASPSPPLGTAYDQAARCHSLTFPRGTVGVHFEPGSNRLDVTIRTVNETDAALGGVRVKPFGPQALPGRLSFLGGTVRFDTNNVPDWPSAATADFGDGALAVGLDGDWSGCCVTAPAGVPVIDLPPLAAGASRTVRMSLRFGASRAGGGAPYALAAEHYRRYGELNPFLGPKWRDRRPIGTLHISSVEYGLHMARNEKNPRGWNIGDPNVDITTEEGLARFHERMMAFARASVTVCTNLNAQGVIVWSIEGQQFPHNISYVGSPDKLAHNAPEMDAIADDWFRVFSDAGLRTGVCLRPNDLWTPPDAPNWRIQLFKWKDQKNRVPDNEAIVDLLDKKIAYARKRWGCTLYYVDSNTYNWPALLDWSVFRDLGQRHPDCLIIPEHETLHYWRVSAPLSVTPAHVHAIWPEAFSVDLMQFVQKCNDGIIDYYSRLVRSGDVLMIDGWYDSTRNMVVKGAYEKGFVARWHVVPEAEPKIPVALQGR